MSLWSLPAGLALRRPWVMGILNVTPDSFSDGGRFASFEAAVARAWQIAREGAQILDLGGQSTRPGSESVPLEEELARVVPVMRELALQDYPLPISVDTSKAAVARACLELGARVINDVTALRGDPEMPALARESGAAVILMHMLGEPRTMQEAPRYGDVVEEVAAFLRERREFAIRAGVAPGRILLDPGIGFGKRLEHNLALLRGVAELRARCGGAPLMIGASRKRFIGELFNGAPVDQRLEGSLAAAGAAIAGGAEGVRVHDVAETVRFLRAQTAIARPDTVT